MLYHQLTRLFVALLFFQFGPSVWAGTIRVETWGVLGPACGSKTSPCISVGSALAIATKNDRIIVGPGVYTGNYTITREGLRLESAEGPHVTILRANNNAVNVISISQRKVRIGRRGKGFTFINATSGVAAGVRVTAAVYDGTRVEGNVFDGNQVGIWLVGNKPVARHNLVLDSQSTAIYVEDAASGLVADNRVYQEEGSGIRLFDSEEISVQNNLVYGALSGIETNMDSDDARIRNNALVGGKGSGNTALSLANAEGLLVDGNVASRGSWGVYLNNYDTQLDAATIRNNAAVGQFGAGFHMGNFNASGPAYTMKFDNNVGIGANTSGAETIHNASFSSVQGNNFYDNGVHGFNNLTASPVLLKKTYFGLVNGTPGLNYNGTNGPIGAASTEAGKPNRFRARKAAKLM